jgi:hypothetical protein
MIPTKASSRRHQSALRTSTRLTGYFKEMYRPGAFMVSPKKVVRVLNEAKVRYVLMGTHGLSGWRSRSRATDDVDVLVAKKDHAKAVRALKGAYPKLVVEDTAIVTRFKDPVVKVTRIDLMKPLQTVYQLVFRHTVQVEGSYRIPDLEMAVISKFAAMVSPNRRTIRKMQDAVDFADMVDYNRKEMDLDKLARLAEMVYSGGRVEILKLVEDVLAGRRFKFDH